MQKSLLVYIQIVALCLLQQHPMFGFDDAAKKQAEDEAAEFILESEFALTDYYMAVEITAESSPDAPLVFTSKGEMHKLICDDGILETCRWTPHVLVDNRANKEDEIPIFAELSSWGKATVKERQYQIRDELFKPCVPRHIDGTIRTWEKRSRCIDLFDWPLHSSADFKTTAGYSKLAGIVFSEKMICCGAERITSDSIKSCWAVRKKSGGFREFTFRSGRPTKQEWIVTNKQFNGEDGLPNRSAGKSIMVSETKWKKLGEGYVPSVVHSVMCLNPWKDSSIIDVVATINVFEKNSKEYQERRGELDQILAKIQESVPK